MESRNPISQRPLSTPPEYNAPLNVAQDPIEAARADLVRAEAQFSEEVKRASYVGGNLVHKAIDDAKPLLITIAVGVTVGVVTLGYFALRGRREEAVIRFAPAPRRHSIARSLAVAAFGAAARFAARRIVAQLSHTYQKSPR
jgi:hypothetical protein